MLWPAMRICTLQLGSRNGNLIIVRYLNAGEVATALRPFYFKVHPDLFGQFPEERLINENALKTLSGYLENVKLSRSPTPVQLHFYLKPVAGEQQLRRVHVTLRDRSVRRTIVTLLESCKLPTTHLNAESPRSKPQRASPEWLRKQPSNFTNDETEEYERQVVKKKFEDDRLLAWLEKHHKAAKDNQKACQPIREEIDKLKTDICNQLKLKCIKWESGWNISHFRGALESFRDIIKHHEKAIACLRDKTLIFGSDSGVNLDGDIMLNCGEVRHNWLDVLRKVQLQDEVLLRLPAFEKAVSRVLHDIKIVHRKFQPKVMAGHYESQLRRLTTSLSDFKGRVGYPRHWPSSLSEFELVVETESGPLMLSPTGQFIVPSSCPAFLLVNFISENLDEARKRLDEYSRTKLIEDNIVVQVAKKFSLAVLRKDDNITPALMIAFCEKVLLHEADLSPLLHGSTIFVTTYYSLLSDGLMCLPWNWNL